MIKVEGIEIEGAFSAQATADRTKNPVVITVTGTIRTAVRLPAKFSLLEGGRGVCYGISIVGEAFGSEDPEIVYAFTAEKYEIKGGDDSG